jgi:ribosome-binding factor A
VDPLRTQRVSQAMREELSELIRFELSDPRLGQVDVTEVHVAADLKRADVLVVLPPDRDLRADALVGLEHARHYLRRQLMQRLDLFRMPELRFVPAVGGSADLPIEKLRRRIRRGRPRDAGGTPPE